MLCVSCGSTGTVQRKQGKHIGEYCAGCDKWIRWVSGDWRSFIWPVGSKHKGQTLAMILLNDRPYLEWAAENMTGSLQKRAREALAATKGSQPTPKQSGDKDAVDQIEQHLELSLIHI